ncbi:heme exporter protein CcmB [Parachryseolinea silvisoli]|jgi:heme exporter protein B|uniref:heme exporter protein CcmB n=1 Tax=Parachryseolinea silvisoli TaxID=2873601 RepID=UPI0022659096|nr:heme exporter protein CcmB [Parachryseolinea silvisoli]MCD9019611.1 heme exporter protein CcmB [Parachryseolinea silvisoli]
MLLTLIRKEFMLELRRKAVISGIGLYMFSLIFICYLTFSLRQNSINEATWSALFWLAILFSVVNSVAKSFIGEKRGVSIYYYTLASPQVVILSKILYNTLLCLVLSFTGYGLFALFIDNPVQDTLYFLLTLLLTSMGFSSALTLISGIAAKANNSHILMAVLSFPVVIAILLMAIRLTKNVLDGIDRSASLDELLNLLAINCILTALAYLLFPYIWRS